MAKFINAEMAECFKRIKNFKFSSKILYKFTQNVYEEVWQKKTIKFPLSQSISCCTFVDIFFIKSNQGPIHFLAIPTFSPVKELTQIAPNGHIFLFLSLSLPKSHFIQSLPIRPKLFGLRMDKKKDCDEFKFQWPSHFGPFFS